MTTSPPYIVTQKGDNLARVLAETGGSDETVRTHGGNQDLFGGDRAMQAPLEPGAVVHGVRPVQKPTPVNIGQNNPVMANIKTTKIRITVFDAKGQPEKEGTAYRLTITTLGRHKVQFEGDLTSGGLIEREVPVGVVTVEWIELPVTYSFRKCPGTGRSSRLAACRERLFAPGTVANMEASAKATIDPDTVEFDDYAGLSEEEGVDATAPFEPNRYLAAKITALREADEWSKPPSSHDQMVLWDNRWFALRPLLPPWLPVPNKDAPERELSERIYREKHERVVLKSNAVKTEIGEARAAPPWYNEEHQKMHLLGLRSPPLTRTNAFTTMATAVNKRLVRMWMGEILAAADKASHATIRNWFSSGDGRVHFQNWCGLVTVIGHYLSTGEHASGHAIDIDKRSNPWAPVYSSEQRKMLGEPPGRMYMDALYGRIYDRALRLFLASGAEGDPTEMDPDAKEFADKYYRNAWDWTPDTLREVLIRLQVLNWSLIAYFDYRFRRTRTRKPTWRYDFADEWRTYSDACREPSPKPTDLEIWQQIDYDCTEGRLSPHAVLIFEKAPPALGPFATTQTTRDARGQETTKIVRRAADDMIYPHGKTRVWRASLRALLAAATTDDEKAAMGAALRQQIEDDHQNLRSVIGSDPCRGVFNLAYDVTLAFGRMLRDAREVRLLRMLSFGCNPQASGGDFMHLDYRSVTKLGAGMREIDYLRVFIDGREVATGAPWVGKVSKDVTMKIARQKTWPTVRSEDVTDGIYVASSDSNVCQVWSGDTEWTLKPIALGECTIEVRHEGICAMQLVKVVA